MIFGAMNNPSQDVFQEITQIARSGFDFVDLTMEPPCAYPDLLDLKKVRNLLGNSGLKAIAHTAYYLPFNNPFASTRRSAVEEMKKVIRAASKLGISHCNFHFDVPIGMSSYDQTVQWYVESLDILVPFAASKKVVLVMENIPNKHKDQMKKIRQLMERVPRLGFHLDVAHAFLEGGMARIQEYLEALGQRMSHVHLSENDGSYDQHLPLGHYQGKGMEWPKIFGWLKDRGYDGTVTLEIFNGPQDGLVQSLKRAREWAR